MNWIKVFAPATVANIGPGFDVLGMAIKGWGDIVTARRSEKSVSILEIVSETPIPKETNANTASIAAIETLKLLGNPGGIELKIEKGLPSGSGLGSSAASAAAGAFAANYLYGNRLLPEEVIVAACNAEEVVSARHADNTAAAILGGGILVKSLNPLEVEKLGSISDLKLILGTPEIEVLTRGARTILPKKISLIDAVSAMANTASVTVAFLKNDYDLLVKSLKDVIIEPHRKQLIPGYDKMKKTVLETGADAVVISGSGPAVCAFSNGNKKLCQSIEEAMVTEFEKIGIKCQSIISGIDNTGTRII